MLLNYWTILQTLFEMWILFHLFIPLKYLESGSTDNLCAPAQSSAFQVTLLQPASLGTCLEQSAVHACAEVRALGSNHVK